MSERKPWQPRVREEPILNPFERPTDWTRDLGANERVEIPEEEGETSEEAEKSGDQPSGSSTK